MASSSNSKSNVHPDNWVFVLSRSSDVSPISGPALLLSVLTALLHRSAVRRLGQVEGTASRLGIARMDRLPRQEVPCSHRSQGQRRKSLSSPSSPVQDRLCKSQTGKILLSNLSKADLPVSEIKTLNCFLYMYAPILSLPLSLSLSPDHV
jgi:hypothetical protein